MSDMTGISLTLMRYFGRQFLIGIGIVAAVVALLIFMVDAIEMLRHHASRDTISAATAIGLSLLKLPNIFEIAFPFTFLFGAMWTFTRLSRSNELVVARASGVSVWQFLAPALIISVSLGLFIIIFFNAASATMLARYKVLERTLLRGEQSTLQIGQSGLWLREVIEGDHRVVHARNISDARNDEDLTLFTVLILEFDGSNRFARRIDAEDAELRDTTWHLGGAWVSPADGQTKYHETLVLPTTLSPKRIQESFAKPETLTIWELSEFISAATDAGFAVNRHRFHWHALISKPFFLAAMVFVAATFSLRLSRMGGVVHLVVAGVVAAFALFFISDVTGALGQSGVVPPALAAWAPTMVSALVGMTMLFHLEDG
ncbi:MAG: LPS export ABC transporter permease LptG [Alphaproteobacteria bacterium]